MTGIKYETTFSIVVVPVLNESMQWRYMLDGEPPSKWNLNEFSDSWPYANQSSLPIPLTTSAYYCASFDYHELIDFVSIEYHVTTRGGYVFYLNGIELKRDNLPSGPLSSSTLSL